MLDRYLLPLTLLQVILIPLALTREVPAPLLFPFACVALLFLRPRRAGVNDTGLSLLADSIVSSEDTGIWKAIRRATSLPHPISGKIAPLIRSFLFGDTDSLSRYSADATLSEFVWLLHLGLSGRKHSVRQISAFSARVKERARRTNAFNSRIGSANSIAMLGLTFFLPLFGGISTAIFEISSSINSFSYLTVQSHFILVLACYIVITMLINAFFRNPLADTKNILYDAIPRVAIAIAILVVSASYTPYIV